MGWKKQARLWWPWAGAGVVLAAVAAVSQIVKQVHIPGAGWISSALVVVTGGVVAFFKPWLTARGDVGAERVKAAAQRSGRAADTLAGLPPTPPRLSCPAATLVGCRPVVRRP